MHRHVYIPFSSCYSLVNYLHDIKLNRGDLSNLCSPHISFAMPFVVDDVHTRRSLGADVVMRHASIILNEELSKNATLGLARMNLLLNSRLGLFRRESQAWPDLQWKQEDDAFTEPLGAHDVPRALSFYLLETTSRRYSGITAYARGHAADFLGFDNINGDDIEELSPLASLENSNTLRGLSAKHAIFDGHNADFRLA